MSYQQAFEKIIKEQVKAHPEAGDLWRSKENGNWSPLADLLRNGQGPFDSDLYCLCYCMTYMHSHYEAAKLPLARIVRTLERRSCVAMLDIGCGPMTAALALADLYHEVHKRRLALNYIGIDLSETMRALAKKFAHRTDCLSSARGGYVRLRHGVSDVTDKILDSWLCDATDVVVSLSYVLAQDAVKAKDVEAFAAIVGRISKRAGTRPVWLSYSNARIPTYLDHFLARCAHHGATFASSGVSWATHPMRQHRLKKHEIVVEHAGKKDNLEYLAIKVT